MTQSAFFKRREERYDAEIIAVSSDTIECRVVRPPRRQKDAAAIVWEQYFSCEDIVTRGVGMISDLGAMLNNSRYWFFWRD